LTICRLKRQGLLFPVFLYQLCMVLYCRFNLLRIDADVTLCSGCAAVLQQSLNQCNVKTVFIRIFYTSQFVKTVGLEDVFGFTEIRILNFLTNKKGNLRRFFANSQSWQGHKDLNPEPTVLELLTHCFRLCYCVFLGVIYYLLIWKTNPKS